MRSIIRAFLILIFIAAACKKSNSSDTEARNGSGNSSSNQVSGQIGAAGGSINAADGSWTLTVPAGALPETKTISVTENATAIGSVPADLTGKTKVLHLEPAGLTFSTPATLTLTYAQGSMVEDGIEERMLKYYYINDDSSLAEISATINTASNQITAQIPHFSFTQGLTNSIERINSGQQTNPNVVQNAANRLISYFQGLANDAARNAEFAANAELLTPFLNKLAEILGSDVFTAAFPTADFDGDGLPNSSDPVVGTVGAQVSLISTQSLFVSVNAGAINSTGFVWTSSQTGSYEIRLNGSNCTLGSVLQSGAVTAGANNNFSPLNASALIAGANDLRICVTVGAATTFRVITIIRDESAPTANATPSGGTYGYSYPVSMSCSDPSLAGCDKVAFTVNGTDPTFDVAGTVTNGVLYASMWQMPVNGTTVLKIRSRDSAGNVSNVATHTYTVSAIPPTTTASPDGGAFNSQQIVTLTCTDLSTGCKRIVYTTNGSQPTFSPLNGTIVTGATAQVTAASGDTRIRFRSENNAGYLEPDREVLISVSSSGFTYAATDRGLARGIGSVPASFVNITGAQTPSAMFINSYNGIIYVGDAMGLLLSTDNGNTWTRKGTNNGLGAGQIMGIYAYGNYVFIATLNGLSISSDSGGSFVNKTTANGLPDNYVMGVTGNAGKVYLATYSGLAVTADNGVTFSVRTTANGLGHNLLYGVHADGDHIYAVTYNSLAISSDGGQTFINRTSAHGLHGCIRNVFAAGNLVVTGHQYEEQTCNDVISVSTDGGASFQVKTSANGLGHGPPRSIFQHQSKLFVTTYNGLSYSTNNGTSFTNLTTANGLASNVIVNGTANGTRLLVATSDAQLTESLDGGITFATKWIGKPLYNSLLKVKREGNFLAAIPDHAGLYLSSDSGITFERKTDSDGLGYLAVYDLDSNSSGLYAATALGLSISTNNALTFVNRTTANGLGADQINAVFATSDKLYAGTSSGLSISSDSGQTFVNRTTANGLGADAINCIFVDGTNVLAGTGLGISISVDGGVSFTNRTTTNGLGSNDVRSVFATAGKIYVGSFGGLSMSSDGGATFANKTMAHGLGDNIVFHVSAVGNTVYAGTAGGLSISVDGGLTFVNRTTANGLGGDVIRGVLYEP